MTAVVRNEQYWTPQRRLMAGQSQGRRSGRLAGGHIADRVGMRKAISLCGSCVSKFDSASVGYVTKSNLPFVQGRCDGCQQFTPMGHLLVHHTLVRNL